LARRGFQIFSETSGAGSLKLHNNDKFDLIFADYKLDDMFGYTLCAHVKNTAHLRQVPLIIASHNIPKHIHDAEQSGACTVLLKPLTPKKLLTTITASINLQMIRNRRIAVNVEVLCKSGEKEFFCNSVDVSNTGILLESDKLDIGSQVLCHFALPNSNYVEAAGKVIRSVVSREGKPRRGVYFDNIPMTCLRTIISYVTARMDSGPDAIVPHYLHQQSVYV